MKGTLWTVRACFFVYGILFATWASRIPQIKAALHLSDGQLGKILFAMPIGQLISLQFSGKLAARLGSHRIIPPGLMAYAAVLVLLGWASESWQLALALLAFGLTGNIASTSLQTQGVQTEKALGRPLMPAYHGVWSVGGFTAGSLGLLMAHLGLSPAVHFQLVSACCLCLLPFSGRFLYAGDPAATPPPPLAAGRAPRFDPVLVQLGVIGFCSMGVEGCMFDWSGVYFRDVVHAPTSLVALGYTAFMVTAAAGRLFGGGVVARLGRRRVIQAGGLLTSLALGTCVLLPSLAPATLACMLVGLGVSNILPNCYSMAGQLRPHDPGNAIAGVAQVSFLGFLIGPPLIGGVASHFGLRASFALIACLGLAVPWLASRAEGLRDA